MTGLASDWSGDIVQELGRSTVVAPPCRTWIEDAVNCSRMGTIVIARIKSMVWVTVVTLEIF